MFTCTLQTNTHIFTNQSRHTHHFFLSGNSFPTPRSTLTSLCSQGMFGSNMFMLTGYKCTHRSGLSWTPTIALLNSVIQCVFECGLSPHCAWSSACNWNNLCCNTMGNKEVTWRFVFLVFTRNADVLGGGYCWGPKQCVGGWLVPSRTQGFPAFWENPSNCFEGLQALLHILKIG